MLHAIAQNKSTVYRRYLSRSQREAEGERVTQEDEITSVIFGAHDYLPEASVAAFWTGMLHLFAPQSFAPPGIATAAKLSFWPGRNRIQPDMMIELLWGNEHRLILVELKWMSGLSSDKQLHDQWLSFLTPAERRIAVHMFIGRDSSEGYKALTLQDVWGGRLVPLTWSDVLYCIKSFQDSSGRQFNLWSIHCTKFLGRLGIAPFTGFKFIPTPDIPHGMEHVFWQASHGVAGLPSPDVPEYGERPIFFISH